MKFLSNILATAGLVVDGVVTLNNTATGQTPNANDNSTKLATTAWVRTFVQPYSLPIASASVLGGIKVGNGLSIDAITGVLTASGGGNVGSFRSKQVFTATAAQTTFTVSGGYTPGFIDVFLNGVYINDDLYTATNSSTIVLDEAAALDDIITVFIYSPYYVGESPSSRDICTFTATAGQTTFSCSYVIGAVDVYYNGSKLAGSEFNASNGTTVVLNTACDVGDFVEVISWVAGGGLSSSRTITIDGVTQDLTANRTWSVLPTGGAAGDILAKVSATNYDVTWIPNFTSTVQHTVKAAVSLTKGQAVYVSSADGTNMIVSKASNASEQTSSKTLGLVAQNLAINGQGFVVTEGLLAGLDTSTAQAGDPVWLGTDGNLIFGLVNKPYAPAHLVFIGVVTRVQQNNGEIFVKVQNGFEFDELHNLSVRNASDGDMIKYVASTGLWTKIAATTTNITEGTNLYYTDTRARAAISLTTSGTSGAATYDNTTGVLNIPQYQGGVTSFNTRTGAITLSSSDVTTALTYTPVTNARTLTINGTTYDLSADRSWSIAAGVTSFNTRTGAISLTSLDVTDALTYTPVTNARTLSINGTTYDLTANRSWTVGVNPSAREIQTFTATANQTTFTITGGYVVGLVDVFINGVRLTASDFTATNGTTVVLTTGTGVNNIVDVIKYTSAYIIDNALRQTTYFTATAGQTTFTVSYSPGLVDVFYNGSKLPSSEYTAVNGTTIVLTTPAILNDTIEVTAYNYTAGAFTGQAQLNGTGFVKVSGTTVSYDNSTYLTTSSATSTYQTILTNPVTGTGTSGQVAYFNGTTSITSESNLFWDSTNDRLGIGTPTPSNPLHIVSNTLSQLNIQALSGNTNAQINLEPSGTGIALIGPANNVDLAFRTNASIKLRLDKDGNLGLGVTPSAWNSAYKAMQFGTTGAIFGESGDAANYFTTNTFVDSVGFKYITSDWALGYFQENGVHSWRNAPSGTAGNAISFTQAMTLFSTGNLLVGSPSPISDNGARLQVSGNGNFFSNSSTAGNANGIRVEQAGTGDSAISFLLTGVREWLVGIDNSDSDTFKINNNTGGSDFNNVGLAITTTGAATFSSSVRADAAIVSMQSNPALDAIIAAHNSVNVGMEMRYFPNNAQGFIDNTYPVTAGQVFGDIYFRQNVSGTMTSRMMIQARSGNVGIGTTSPLGKLDVYRAAGGSGTAAIVISNGEGGGGRNWGLSTEVVTAGDFAILQSTTNGGTPSPTSTNVKFYINPSGNVGIGTPTVNEKLDVEGNFVLRNSGTYSTSLTREIIYRSSTVSYGVQPVANIVFGTTGDAAGEIRFVTRADAANYAERMRITSGGAFKAKGTESTYHGISTSYHELRTGAGNQWAAVVSNTAGLPYGLNIDYNSSPNSSLYEFLFCTDAIQNTLRASIRSNGGIANYQANDANLSDERTKKDIEPLESYWEKFKAIEIVKFKYKDQTHDDFNIGVIAQQVEQVAPEFVDVDGWDTKPKVDEEGNEIVSEEEPLKSIYTADLHHATIKVLQEAMAKIEELQAKLDKNNIN